MAGKMKRMVREAKVRAPFELFYAFPIGISGSPITHSSCGILE